VIAMAMLLHGLHLDAETEIRTFAYRFPFCQLTDVGDATSRAPRGTTVGTTGETTGGGIRPDETAVSDHGVIISRATAGVIRRGPYGSGETAAGQSAADQSAAGQTRP